tara:strand:+ start:167 stop:547 length:381 start_codon:yes stop_codon:yes gene_type:complete
MKHWQRGLTRYELVSGTPGEGAKMKLFYDFGKRKTVLTETILKRNLPHEFYASYTTKGVYNVKNNYFEPVLDGKTKWTSKSEFQFKDLAMKAISLLMPGAFKKQSLKYMLDFKSFAEDGTSVINNF